MRLTAVMSSFAACAKSFLVQPCQRPRGGDLFAGWHLERHPRRAYWQGNFSLSAKTIKELAAYWRLLRMVFEPTLYNVDYLIALNALWETKQRPFERTPDIADTSSSMKSGHRVVLAFRPRFATGAVSF